MATYLSVVTYRPKLRYRRYRRYLYSCRFAFLIVTVTKLREHWDETNSKVTQRKTQLDTMLVDSQQYEAKRIEVENWLQRMEARFERMTAVGHTADVLEAQLREQKVPTDQYYDPEYKYHTLYHTART